MLPAITMIISIYCIIRLIDLSNHKETNWFVIVLCVLGVVVIAFNCWDVMSAGIKMSQMPSFQQFMK